MPPLVQTNLGSVGGGHPGDDSQALALSIWCVVQVKRAEAAGLCLCLCASLFSSKTFRDEREDKRVQ